MQEMYVNMYINYVYMQNNYIDMKVIKILEYMNNMSKFWNDISWM